MTDDLQTRFAEALRRAFADPAAGAVVTVRAPDVTFAPTIKTTLPALEGPLPVVDIERFGGAFEFEVRPIRDADGLLISARLVPVAFHPFKVSNT